MKPDNTSGQQSEVIITSYSQPHVLHRKMKEESLTHGETVMANISPVRMENRFGRMILYFCPMQNIQIVEKITPGDGLMLPAEATLEGLTIPAEASQGFYSLKNVILSSNGTMQVKATPATEWERVGKQIEGIYY